MQALPTLKFEVKSENIVFIDYYYLGSKGYKFYNPEIRKITIGRHAEFDDKVGGIRISLEKNLVVVHIQEESKRICS